MFTSVQVGVGGCVCSFLIRIAIRHRSGYECKAIGDERIWFIKLLRISAVLCITCSSKRSSGGSAPPYALVILAAQSSLKKLNSLNWCWSWGIASLASFGGVRMGRSVVNSESKLETSSKCRYERTNSMKSDTWKITLTTTTTTTTYHDGDEWWLDLLLQ